MDTAAGLAYSVESRNIGGVVQIYLDAAGEAVNHGTNFQLLFIGVAAAAHQPVKEPGIRLQNRPVYMPQVQIDAPVGASLSRLDFFPSLPVDQGFGGPRLALGPYPQQEALSFGVAEIPALAQHGRWRGLAPPPQAGPESPGAQTP